jgi:peptidoglycan/xylan/chitin deacetylase (PgdA/CDA1 family)
MPTPNALYLSFDIEEFDMPFEYGKTISFEDQISISIKGCHDILDLLKKHQAKATFFSTAVFAISASEIIKRINDEGHELASHGYYHSDFKNEHLSESKKELERLSGQNVKGYRMARMMPLDSQAVASAGYNYNSSLNPVYLPGRYNNYFKPRTSFINGNLLEIPASATPYIRLPLFWLSFHNLPLFFYKWLCRITMWKDNYLNIYFHPWEFTDLKQERFGLPDFVTRQTGSDMIRRFDQWLAWCKKRNYVFSTLGQFVHD